jgi:glutathione synthase/RimK-type ligase-like ATP-grasp enzyme
VRVLLVYTDDPDYQRTGYAEAWTRALEEKGSEVERLPRMPPEWSVGGPPTDRWDLVIPHVLVEEVAAYAGTLKLAALVERLGLPMLNSTACIVASSDKLVTHAVWAAAGLSQPGAWDLSAVQRWPSRAAKPLVIKPAYCDGARHIELVRSLDEAREVERAWREDEVRGGEVRGPAILQEWVEEPAVVRVYATPDETSLAYEKARKPGALTTHGTVYPKVYEPPPEMAELAQRMVGTLGGGLMGVDVLTDESGRHFALEANAPFGFDVTDPEQGRFVAGVAVAIAERATAPAR